MGQKREEAANGATADGWATRLAKLIPAEALGVYGAALGLIPSLEGQDTVRLVLLIVVTLACLAILIAVRIKSTAQNADGPQPLGIAISCVAFLIWTATLGPTSSPFPIPKDFGFIVSLVGMLYVALVGVFYRGDTTT
ncbi:hypothetical protein ASD21_13980 [Caulobacter sp. Root1455]|nr:hypothetical protein ASD38_13045 [Caulobacter sp. Root487D2Y]KQY92501.1 hypothetical protein ASD21_13980 [Caulobacter sp. Root1455]